MDLDKITKSILKEFPEVEDKVEYEVFVYNLRLVLDHKDYSRIETG